MENPQTRPRQIALLDSDDSHLREHINRSGTELCSSVEAEGLVVGFGAKPRDLHEALERSTKISWVQLPSAGIEAFSSSLALRPEISWTSAKGAYARPVAEHALALTLALLRDLPQRAKATSWGTPSGISLHGLNVVVVGAGGVAVEIIRLLKMFDVNITVIRRLPTPVQGADRTLGVNELPAILPRTDVLILAAALTPETRKLIDAHAFSLMKTSAVLVNIGRGALIDTNALCTVLASNGIAGAALDVTDPEPLPDGHLLWGEPRCLITPHTADTMEMIRPLYAARVESNVQSFLEGLPLEGIVDAAAGY